MTLVKPRAARGANMPAGGAASHDAARAHGARGEWHAGEDGWYSGRMPSALEAHIAPARRLSGRLRVPGDKSISHRYALLAALADGTSRITNYSPGADCAATLDCLRALGVAIHREADPLDGRLSTVIVAGRGLGRLRRAHRDARRAELGHDDAAARRHPRGPSLHRRP